MFTPCLNLLPCPCSWHFRHHIILIQTQVIASCITVTALLLILISRLCGTLPPLQNPCRGHSPPHCFSKPLSLSNLYHSLKLLHLDAWGVTRSSQASCTGQTCKIPVFYRANRPRGVLPTGTFFVCIVKMKEHSLLPHRNMFPLWHFLNQTNLTGWFLFCSLCFRWRR